MSQEHYDGWRRDREIEEFGLLEPGQPTETAHIEHVRAMQAEFSPAERRLIRANRE